MVHSFKKQTKQNKKELCVCDNTGQYCYFIRNSYQTSRSPSTAAKQWQEVLKLVYLFTRVLNETKDKKKKKTQNTYMYFYSAFASIKAFSIYLSERNIFTRLPHTPVQLVFSRRRVNFFLRTLSVSKWLNNACSVMYVDYSLKSPKIATLCCLCQAWGDLGCTFSRAGSFPPS